MSITKRLPPGLTVPGLTEPNRLPSVDTHASGAKPASEATPAGEVEQDTGKAEHGNAQANAVCGDVRSRTAAAKQSLPSLESQLRRFDPRIRRTVRALARRSSRVADLIHVFPGAAHVLADDATDAQTRSHALADVEAGGSLKAVTARLGVPSWLRRLPPDAFRGPLPPLPNSAHFVRRISTRLPRKRDTARPWLEAVAFAAQSSDEAFAVWVAERPEILPCDRPVPEALRALALYAWASRASGGAASDLVLSRWHPEIPTGRAICAAMSFLKRIDLIMSLSGVELKPWLEPGKAGDYSFVALTTAPQLLEEARAMRNCVDHYARLLRENRCQLYSVRRGDTRVATLEVGPHAKELSTLTVTQLRGIANVRSQPEIWAAAYAWLAAQGPKLVVEHRAAIKPVGETEIWSSVFGDYFAEHPEATWWPRSCDVQGLWALASDLAAVARKARVASWQFG